MSGNERVSGVRLLHLWTAGLAMFALNLGDQVVALPLSLLLSVVACIAVRCSGRDVEVWWVYGAVLVVTFLGMSLFQVWSFARLHVSGGGTGALLGAYAVLACASALSPRRHRVTYVALVVVHVGLAALLLHHVPVVSDVQALLDGALSALVSGSNPYGITVQGVYAAQHDWNYGPGVLVDGRIMYGYPYLPAPLLALIPAYLLGDLRWAYVAAMVLTSVLVRRMTNDFLGRSASVLVLVMPIAWAMTLNFWIEPILLLLTTLVAATMRHARSQSAIWFGLFLGSKQYALVHLPLLWMLLRHAGRRSFAAALAIPAALVLFFVVWDPAAFVHSAVEFHLRQPYRYDTVTLTPALERLLGSSPGFLFGPYGIVLGAVVSSLLAWRCRPGPDTLTASVGLSLAVMVLFSKQGHANYWGLVGGCLLVAVATHGRKVAREQGAQERVTRDERVGSQVERR